MAGENKRRIGAIRTVKMDSWERMIQLFDEGIENEMFIDYQRDNIEELQNAFDVMQLILRDKKREV